MNCVKVVYVHVITDINSFEVRAVNLAFLLKLNYHKVLFKFFVFDSQKLESFGCTCMQVSFKEVEPSH